MPCPTMCTTTACHTSAPTTTQKRLAKDPITDNCVMRSHRSETHMATIHSITFSCDDQYGPAKEPEFPYVYGYA